MMPSSFIIGTSIYALIVQIAYSFVLLTLFYGSAVFRDATISPVSDNYYSNYVEFGQKP